ncbi:GNAT family N-acetyltransferase [Myceligenerans xiligouense]|uniref:Acetyltransferase (GNAT) family protein n=1 Tax=Myceligenerans xiligouense TaxID=253184 RepID=A0A3N4Z579_9MICO|nr:GNAT family N-acetyltransferase [Myceligenerans xiligouense]RPF21078.1 acetyltransferase (GNAT) family protein [Myceligenerans xiligouense]
MVTIEPLTGSEPDLYDLLVLGGLPKRAEDLAQGLAPRDFLYGAHDDDGVMLGMAFGLKSDYFHHHTVNNLLVHPDHRRAGIGTTLMNYIIEEARRVGHGEVILDLHPARPAEHRPFYSTLGFEMVDSSRARLVLG